MNDYDLPQDEQQLVEDIERGVLTPAPDFTRRKQEVEACARQTLNKTRNINIRLSERDVHRLKTRAAEEGLPYQTYAASLLHKAMR